MSAKDFHSAKQFRETDHAYYFRTASGKIFTIPKD